MRRMLYLVALCLFLGLAWGCATSQEQPLPPSSSTPTTSARVRVADVTNGTKELFDVDVIGMLWTGFNESLNRRGLLYMGVPGPAPLKLEATIVKYQKGNIWIRPVLPKWGKTQLVIKADLKDGDTVIATIESSHSVSGTFTKGAWRKVFTELTEDVVGKIAGKI